jgi:hypothetical protein
MDPFVAEDSIVRKIWGKSDSILFIFAGAAAEFALNKAVDWLYFTGKLPADPLGRLFSTVAYARQIVFSEKQKAWAAIDTMRSIHSRVEESRGSQIPDWAYRDVLFMLIHYSISSFELLERKLTPEEKQEVFAVFNQVGARMGLKDLPADYGDWVLAREQHLREDLVKTNYTTDLFLQYRKHLGGTRYFLLRQSQMLVVPERVKQLLGDGRVSVVSFILPVYKWSRRINLDWFLKSLILPKAYQSQIRNLDNLPQ